MKISAIIKKVLAVLLIASMLVLACSCNSGNEENNATGSPDSSASPATEKETEKPTEAEKEAPVLDTDLLLSSSDKPVRVVYADGYKSEANKIFDKLVALDVNFKIGKYTVSAATGAAEDGAIEIIIGDTDRAATADAKAFVAEASDHYAICVSGSSVAIYSSDEEGIKAGVEYFISKMTNRGSAVVYDNAGGNYLGEFERTQLLEALAKVARDEGLPVYRISVYDANGLNTETINASNPCQNCYSVAKLYCVTAIGMLFDEGKIKVTDTIGSIFAEELAEYGIDPAGWNKVTVHDVMRHRAGFEHGFLDIDAEDSTKFSSQDFLKIVLSEPLVYEPGEKSVYTDAAYYLISRVVTKISGEMLDVFLAKRLFNLTECREYAFSRCPEGYPIGATGLYIRSADVAKLGRIYLDGGKYGDTQIISEEWIDMVLSNGYELHRSGSGYSKGGMRGQQIYINYEKNVAVAWHSYDPSGANAPLSEKLHSYLG